MPCKLTYDAEGKLVSAVCSFGRREKKCRHCRRPSTKLCDFKLKTGRTCDYPICPHCSTHQEPDTDYCKDHFEPFDCSGARGRWFEAKYKSVCCYPNCRRRVELGERILWLGTGRVLCGECAAILVTPLSANLKSGEV